MNTFCAFQLQCMYYSVAKLNLEITVLILQATFKLFCGAIHTGLWWDIRSL